MLRSGKAWNLNQMHCLPKQEIIKYHNFNSRNIKSLIILMGLNISINISSANDFEIGKALYAIGIAEHLRDSITLSECKQYITPSVLGAFWDRDYRKLTQEISSQLSAQDQIQFKTLASSEKYKNQQRQSQHTYITEPMEGFKKSGVPVTFACGFVYAKVFDAMGRAESAIRTLQKR